MKKEELKQLAKQIYQYEQQISEDKNLQKNKLEIENIMMTLSFEDVLILDEIIRNKNF